MIKLVMGRKIEVKLKLKKKDLEITYGIIRAGNNSVRVIKRAQVLNNFHKGFSSVTIANHVGVSPETARRIAHRYNSKGLEHALYENERPGGKRRLDQIQSSKLIAIACTDPPEGFARWTLDLLQSEAVKQKIVKSVARETIRVLLHRHDIKPWREKNVVYPTTK